jgi:hypothetical protein
MQSFQDLHRGYRLARIVNEIFGRELIDVVIASRSWEERRLFRDIDGVLGYESHLSTLTREQAAQWRTPLLPMFVYSAPQAFFTAAEQELLRSALDGGTDVDISRRLGVPLTAVKARWQRIHDRMLTRAPHVLEQRRESQYPERRGGQMRHAILAFVRANPSELTPYARPTGQTVPARKHEPARF